MSNWFAGIGQASSGIDAARYGLSVVSQNIANADTEGYNRQRADQVSVDGTIPAGLYTTHSQNLLGGTRVASVSRVVDPVLDARVRSEHARGATADTAASDLSDIEGVFPEPGANGLSARLDDFWKSWGTLANNPADAGTRAAVISAASSVASSLHNLSDSLDAVATGVTAALGDDVAQANSAAARLAVLNGQISVASATGQNANNLLDQRDQLLDTLSKVVGGTATIGPDGAATVTVGGRTLVTGSTAGTVAVAGNAVTVDGTAVTLSGGSASSRVATLTTTLPGYRAQLDAVANAVAGSANTIQSKGYDLAGNAGTPLFSGSGAAGITVALTDGSKLAASGTPGTNLDGSNALAASHQGTTANGPDAQYRTLVAGVGSAAARAQQAQATQDAVVANVDALRASVSGVSYDDEVSQLLTYQHAFQASSRVLTTLDQMLDTLINHTGVVGQA